MSTIRGMTGMDAITFSRPMSQLEAWTLARPVLVAFERLRSGVGSRDDLAAVGAGLNLAWLRCQSIGDSAEAMAVIERASRVLLAIERRTAPGESFAINPITEHYPACNAINLFDKILRSSSLRQWEFVEQKFMRWMQSAGARAA